MDPCIQELPGEGESGGCDPSSKLDYWGPGKESWDQHVLESHFSPISLCHPKEPGGITRAGFSVGARDAPAEPEQWIDGGSFLKADRPAGHFLHIPGAVGVLRKVRVSHLVWGRGL